MSNSPISLNASLRTCKVDQGWASRIQSDRFENPDLLVCPVWSGFDLTNRAVCMDTFPTKSAGCNSALDRIAVENYLRPQYMEYINLDAEGFRYDNDIYVKPSTESQCNAQTTNKNMNCYDSGVRQIGMNQLNEITGNFGQSPSSANLQFRCGSNCYEQAMKQEYNKESYVSEKSRQLQAVQHAVQSSQMRKQSGMS
jgi:hypothetical protein